MTTINSVLGPLDTADLGFTLMHEHLLVAAGGVYRDYPELLGPNKMERVIQRLKEAKEGGIDTIVDCTTLDLGRDVELLAEAARKSGMNIIACAGWWLDVPRFFEGVTADQMAALFVREIEQGISGTSIKAGILKSASDMFGVTPEQEVMLRAVARAHLETGVPIMVHSYPAGQVGREQIAILKEEGVDLSRVKLDHSNDTTDVEYLTWLMEQGCYLGMDRYPGRNVSPPARTRTLKTLMDDGYTDRLCPSHDGITLRVNPDTPGILPTEEEMKTINPHGYLYIKKIVFAQLREMGISEDLLNRLCVTAPKNFFEG